MGFMIYFLNVGEGDCTVIELPDNNVMVVDVRNARFNSWLADPKFENPITYLSKISTSSLFRYVQTHPEMDHMDGLADLQTKFPITNFWDTQNNRVKPTEFSSGFREEDWDAYEKLHKSETVKFRFRSTDAVSLQNGTFPYNIYVVSPSRELTNKANENEDWNLLSYVILIEYQRFKLLLGGDASDEAWQDIYEWTEQDSTAKALLSNITVFKASHHGRNSSYCGVDMLDLMKPQKIVISKGSVPGEQSAYGKYYDWAGGADNMFLTSQGTIIVDYYDLQNRRYSIKYVGSK